MRSILNLFVVFLSISAYAQVAIGKTTVDTGALLDFSSENKGIILPIVETLPTAPLNGTFIMDGRTGQLKVSVYENDMWKDLSDMGSISVETSNGTNTTTAATINISTEKGNGVVITDKPISTATTSSNGVLVLDSDSKALVLPKVANPHLNIKSPRAGTICYDTASDSLAVFDGKVWNYWK